MAVDAITVDRQLADNVPVAGTSASAIDRLHFYLRFASACVAPPARHHSIAFPVLL